MSTNGMTTWAVDLAEIGAIYPFPGWEFIMFLLGLAFWIWWHWVQIRREARELGDEARDGEVTEETTRRAIERY